MHDEILIQEQQDLLHFIKRFSSEFGLVGGTAIALHLGHRRSIDFDLFSHKSFSLLHIRNRILQERKIEHTFVQGENELTVLVNKVKVTFYYFPYPISFRENFNNVINLPDLQTLGAMKAFALGKRAKWKDYVDLYFLIKKLGMGEIVKITTAIFGSEFNEKLFRVQLGYFNDIDYSEEVEYMPGFEVAKNVIENFLMEQSLK